VKEVLGMMQTVCNLRATGKKRNCCVILSIFIAYEWVLLERALLVMCLMLPTQSPLGVHSMVSDTTEYM